MTRNHLRSSLLLAVATLSLSWTAAMAGTLPYTIDILSSDNYHGLRDSWMLRINDQGLAAGYIATQSSSGPYLPTIYRGGGQFQTLGVESRSSSSIVTGMNDRGDVVGNLRDPNSNLVPYIYLGGTIGYPSLPSNLVTPSLLGIINTGLAYGRALDPMTNSFQVFTAVNGNVTVLPLSAPGVVSWFPTTRMLSDGGLLGVVGVSIGSSSPFLYDLNTATLSALVVPDGFATASLLQITNSGLIFGSVLTEDLSLRRFGFWNPDGSFRGFFDVPDGIGGILINNLGQAIGLDDGQALFYDGSTWNPLLISGLNGYTLSRISDFNDRGQFVGLVNNPDGSFLWGFVASPVPEPPAQVLLACGMAGIGGYALRRRFSAKRRMKSPLEGTHQ